MMVRSAKRPIIWFKFLSTVYDHLVINFRFICFRFPRNFFHTQLITTHDFQRKARKFESVMLCSCLPILSVKTPRFYLDNRTRVKFHFLFIEYIRKWYILFVNYENFLMQENYKVIAALAGIFDAALILNRIISIFLWNYSSTSNTTNERHRKLYETFIEFIQISLNL